MDSFEAPDISFLDLSDVDEKERRKVLNSLHSPNQNVQLPWITWTKVSTQQVVEQRSIIRRQEPSRVHNKPVLAPPYQVHFIQNQPDYNAIYQRQPPLNYAMHPTPMVVYAPVPYQQSYANVAYTNNYSYAQPTVTNSMPYMNTNYANSMARNNNVVVYSNNISPYGGHSSGGYERQPVENPISPPIEKPQPTAHVSSSIGTGNVYIDAESVSVNVSLPPEPVLTPKNQQNGTKEVKKNGSVSHTPSPASNKSWASLFSNSRSTDVLRNANTAETVNASDEENVIGEANGNTDRTNSKKCQPCIDPISYRMAEYLKEHAVDGRTISLQPRGLINKSNYCYINSILQALLACPPMYNLLSGLAKQNTTSDREKVTPIIDGMCRFVKEFKHLPAGLRVNRRNDKNQKKDNQQVSVDCDLPFEPSWFYKVLNGIRSDSFLIEGRQEDAEEFLGCLLNGLNDEMLDLMKLVKGETRVNGVSNDVTDQDSDKEWHVMGPKNRGGITRQTDYVKTPISNIFGGLLKSQVCRAGDQSTFNIQPFFTLQLHIEKVKTVREALEQLIAKTPVEGLTSSKTNEEVEAWQQVTLEELPIVLVLHLKCFDFNVEGCTKIVKALDFPVDLKIDSKWLSSKPPVNQKEKQYKLFAVVYHDGKETTKGHYVTDAFHVGYSSWLRYDDASVKPVQEEHVLKPHGTRVPYLLFYRRSDTIRNK